MRNSPLLLLCRVLLFAALSVSIYSQGGFDFATIGAGGTSGSGSFDTGTSSYTLQHAGPDAIGGTTEDLQFAYKQLSGDGSIIARVVQLNNASTSSVSGLMIRESLDNNSAFFGSFRNYTNSSSYYYPRTATGANAGFGVGSGGAAYTWIKLEKLGNQFICYESSDGIAWSQMYQSSMDMAVTFYCGLALSSGSATSVSTIIDNVAIDGFFDIDPFLPDPGDLPLPHFDQQALVGATQSYGFNVYKDALGAASAGVDRL